ncbi:MAG: pyridoxal-phosphate-dependent aminotransferase family protein [Omnitrophica WOR_2 bacterium]
MKTYPIPMVPGPVRVPPEVLAAYQVDYGSGDLETDFLDLYNRTEANLQRIFGTQNRVAIQTGEGMLGLWGALKSCIVPNDRVLCIATGVFGYGFGDMARATGAQVRTIGLPYDETIHDWAEIERGIAEFAPKMITAVHCETPSGTLNPIDQLGQLKRKYEVPLLYVDVVASLGGAPVLVDEWGIDLALGGSQKVISAPPDMTFVAVSQKAWEIIETVNYPGYDALKPFQTAQQTFYFPYTPYWHGMAALYTATRLLLDEGLPESFSRHEKVASHCREQIQAMELSLYPAIHAVNSPTVTAVKVPESFTWQELDTLFRLKGLVVGGSYGPLSGKVFRIGHMGTQANMDLLRQALEVIQKVTGSH